nr:hypothetical protein Iba_chr06cCG7080 [Ipomoea batatas]
MTIFTCCNDQALGGSAAGSGFSSAFGGSAAVAGVSVAGAHSAAGGASAAFGRHGGPKEKREDMMAQKKREKEFVGIPVAGVPGVATYICSNFQGLTDLQTCHHWLTAWPSGHDTPAGLDGMDTWVVIMKGEASLSIWQDMGCSASFKH